MRTEQIVTGVLDRYAVYTEFHPSPNPRGTIILVNGALGTTTAFTQTIKYLLESFNVVAFDLPFAGRSKPHNRLDGLIFEDEEVAILLDLIARFRCSHVLAASWGSVAALLALARRPAGVRAAVAVSFSPIVNASFRHYMSELRLLLETAEGRDRIGDVVNTTVGRYLPRLIRNSNFRHIATLTPQEYAQIGLYVDQVIMMDTNRYVERCREIDVPVLFVNGELDEYASAEDARAMMEYMPSSSFSVIESAGHFLDLETRDARARTKAAIMGFLNANTGVGAGPNKIVGPCAGALAEQVSSEREVQLAQG
jgi:pimeloyl-ACP methyl ester carboxylesterase